MDSPNGDLMQYLTVKEAAEELELTKERIRQLYRGGKLSGVMTPYGVLFTPGAIYREKRRRADLRQEREEKKLARQNGS